MLETLYRLLSLYGNSFLDVLKINLYFSLCVCVCQVCVKRQVSELLKLLSHPQWVLGTELWSFGRAVSSLNH